MNKEVYEYELELKLENPNTGEVRTVIREETAYNPFDAYTQAVLVLSQNAGSSEIKLVRIGPARAVPVDTTDLEKVVGAAVSRVFKKHAGIGDT